ncbi:MAG: hemolysin family protein [Planctomycetota bacterium]|nr:hemolysin family protein [Planctomycetota bacterium]
MGNVLWIVVGAAALSVLTVLSREALAAFSFSDMEELLRKKNRTKQDLPRFERFAERLRDYHNTFRLLDYTGRMVLATALWVVINQHQAPAPVLWFIVLVGLALVVLDSVVRPLGSSHAEQLTLWLLRPWTALYVLLWLPTLPFRASAQAVGHLLRSGDVEAKEEVDDEIMAAVSAGEYAGQIDGHERDMIESILDLRDLAVDRLMTPRTDMNAVPLEEGTAGAVALAKQSGHSRLPVYDGNRDNIVGVCYVKDLIGLPPDAFPPLEEVLRKPLLIPESKQVSDLLVEFRRNRIHLAIVIDEYGGTAGLVTIEDIIEEVFGEIDDEYDEEREEEVTPLDDTTMDLDARMHVDEVNERFDFNLPEDEHYESLGGLLTSRLGCIPEVEMYWEGDGARLTVLEATDRRVVRLRLERVDADDSGEQKSAG